MSKFLPINRGNMLIGTTHDMIYHLIDYKNIKGIKHMVNEN